MLHVLWLVHSNNYLDLEILVWRILWCDHLVPLGRFGAQWRGSYYHSAQLLIIEAEDASAFCIKFHIHDRNGMGSREVSLSVPAAVTMS